jgi:hypothetical protein
MVYPATGSKLYLEEVGRGFLLREKKSSSITHRQKGHWATGLLSGEGLSSLLGVIGVVPHGVLRYVIRHVVPSTKAHLRSLQWAQRQ